MGTTDGFLEVYAKAKSGLLPIWEGKFVVLGTFNCRVKITGPFDDRDEALRYAYLVHGLSPFIVKQVLEVEPVERFTRHHNFA